VPLEPDSTLADPSQEPGRGSGRFFHFAFYRRASFASFSVFQPAADHASSSSSSSPSGHLIVSSSGRLLSVRLTPRQLKPLPLNWGIHEDDNHERYFFNYLTGESVWEMEGYDPYMYPLSVVPTEILVPVEEIANGTQSG
jgi:hypothetical protein